MRISDWSSDVCSSDLAASHAISTRLPTAVKRWSSQWCAPWCAEPSPRTFPIPVPLPIGAFLFGQDQGPEARCAKNGDDRRGDRPQPVCAEFIARADIEHELPQPAHQKIGSAHV